MLEFSEKVLVLHVGRFREADAWVRFLSPTRGVLTAFAWGGCKSRRRFCGCLDPFNEVVFKVKSNRQGSYLNLQEGLLTHAPTALRNDPQRLGLAVNCIKFAEAAADMTDGCATTYRLLTETLHVLDSVPSPSAMVPVLFRARLAFEQGLFPQLKQCANCGVTLVPDDLHNSLPAPQASCQTWSRLDNTARLCPSSGGRLLIEQGQTLCHACPPGGKGLHLPVCGASLDVLTLVRDSSPEHWQQLELPHPVRRECAAVMENFVRYHLGLVWDRGGFRRM